MHENGIGVNKVCWFFYSNKEFIFDRTFT